MARTADPHAYEALLEGARVEFARQGPEDARVEDIARRAGVSKGAFYLHFRSKRDAFEVILQRFFGAFEEHARRRREMDREVELMAASGGPGTETLEREIEANAEMLELLWQHRQILAAIDASGGRFWGKFVVDFRSRMRAMMAGRILERQQEGRIRQDIDPGVFADVVVGTYEDLGRRMAEMRAKPDFRAWVRSLLTILYDGILDRSGTSRPAGPGR